MRRCGDALRVSTGTKCSIAPKISGRTPIAKAIWKAATGARRALAFAFSGLAFAFGSYPLNLVFAGLGLSLFLADLTFALRVAPSSR